MGIIGRKATMEKPVKTPHACNSKLHRKKSEGSVHACGSVQRATAEPNGAAFRCGGRRVVAALKKLAVK